MIDQLRAIIADAAEQQVGVNLNSKDTRALADFLQRPTSPPDIFPSALPVADRATRLYVLEVVAGYRLESALNMPDGSLAGHRFVPPGDDPDAFPFSYATKEETEAAAWAHYQKRGEARRPAASSSGRLGERSLEGAIIHILGPHPKYPGAEICRIEYPELQEAAPSAPLTVPDWPERGALLADMAREIKREVYGKTDFDCSAVAKAALGVVIAALTSSSTKPQGVGDHVHVKGMRDEYTGTILGVSGDRAWVNFDSGGYTTELRSNLEPAPKDKGAEP